MPGGGLTVYRNPTRWKAVVQQQEIRHSTAGCLLSVVLFAPLFVRAYGVLAVVSASIFYAVVIVPTVAGYYSLPALVTKTYRLFQYGQTQQRCVNSRGSNLRAMLSQVWFNFWIIADALLSAVSVLCSSFLWPFYSMCRCLPVFILFTIPYCLCNCFLPRCHQAVIKARTLRVLTNQLLFFVVLEALVFQKVKLLAYSHLLAYNFSPAGIYACLASTVGHQIQGVPRESTSYFSASNLYIADKLGKAVTLCSVLSVITYYRLPYSALYTAMTAMYYLLTNYEVTGDEGFILKLKEHQYACFNEEEGLWLPALVNSMPVVLSSVAFISLILTRYAKSVLAETPPAYSSELNVQVIIFICTFFYINILIPSMLVFERYDEYIKRHGVVTRRFTAANEKECEWQGTCAVCLEDLQRGRVTSCGHVYHTHCLTSLLDTNNTRCPLCNVKL